MAAQGPVQGRGHGGEQEKCHGHGRSRIGPPAGLQQFEGLPVSRVGRQHGHQQTCGRMGPTLLPRGPLAFEGPQHGKDRGQGQGPDQPAVSRGRVAVPAQGHREHERAGSLDQMSRRGPCRPALQQEPDAQAGREGRHQCRIVVVRETQIQGAVPPRRAPEPRGHGHDLLLPQTGIGQGPPGPGRSQAARAEKQAGQEASVVQGRFEAGHAGGDGRAELQQNAEDPRDQALLAQSEPDHARPLQGPGGGGPGRVQGHGDGQGDEDDAQGQVGLAQQTQPRAADSNAIAPGGIASDSAHGQQVPQGQTQAAEGPAHVRVAHQPHLQGEGGQGQAEDQCAVQARVLARGTGEEDGDDPVHDEEKDEEGLGGGEVLRRVVARAPGRADAEGAGEAQEVERGARCGARRCRARPGSAGRSRRRGARGCPAPWTAGRGPGTRPPRRRGPGTWRSGPRPGRPRRPRRRS